MTALNPHPLNQQAQRLLSLAGVQLLPEIPPVLQLAMLAIPEGKEDSEEAQWIQSEILCEEPSATLSLLETELPDGLPENPMEAAEDLLRALSPLDPNRDLR